MVIDFSKWAYSRDLGVVLNEDASVVRVTSPNGASVWLIAAGPDGIPTVSSTAPALAPGPPPS